ncbi:MAG: deoxynucleoside kinase [candidate division FCPU426 bacterium]
MSAGPRYIVVEGVIGSGKSHLAVALAESMHARLVKDAAADNPFLENYYKDPRNFAFAVQIFYLLNRHRQQQELAQGDLFSGGVVSDILFARDRIFAYLSLNDSELALYEQLYKTLTRERLPVPDLVVYLQASTSVLASRLRRRGLLKEKGGLSLGVLEELGKAYNNFFFSYSDSPLLVVNTDDLDLAGNVDDLSDLIGRVDRARSGVQYYTPKK